MNEINVNQSKWKANTFRVCDLCYFIILAEQQLFDVEKEFSLAQYIPLVEPDSKDSIQKMLISNFNANHGK
jgi:hypothetical protein